ncbi:PoNi-like cognate immunity protein [Flavobacterium azooxidireducens]|uniref:PoNi-like cognate immunity protein n=1 Tax=Flavobacterium azooxidireducens TaxID=1871076 RepID=A0ABY4KFD8_9FLAO|nr:PoNe immunity protein domain-containing protein [Flavobacterium azooxidireducens]UPQ78115.1 PoNi-like cognate immunity protein [Flavobacterium azooxidireducens]
MRDKGNFSELINILKEDIQYYQKAIISGEAKPERYNDIKGSILIASLEITKAHYSNGADKEVVKQAVLECIPAFEDSFQFVSGFGQYDEMIWLVSMAILCDVSLEDFQRITAILNRDGVNDQLLSFIIKSKEITWEESNSKVIQEHPYAKATNLNTAQDIKNYLDKVWYQGHSDAAWHDTHKNTKVNCYSGYWAWEAAAIAKIKGIEDSSLKTQKYYPYDAVHW